MWKIEYLFLEIQQKFPKKTSFNSPYETDFDNMLRIQGIVRTESILSFSQ